MLVFRYLYWFFFFSLLQADIAPSWYSNHALLEALGRSGKWQEAVSTFEDKQRASAQPPEEPCYRTMLRVCERAGFSTQVGGWCGFFVYGLPLGYLVCACAPLR